MSDDELLLAVMKRLLHDPDRHPAQDPAAWVDRGTFWFDGNIGVSDEEAAAIERAKGDE